MRLVNKGKSVLGIGRFRVFPGKTINTSTELTEFELKQIELFKEKGYLVEDGKGKVSAPKPSAKVSKPESKPEPKPESKPEPEVTATVEEAPKKSEPTRRRRSKKTVKED
jgi:hypothetical protein